MVGVRRCSAAWPICWWTSGLQVRDKNSMYRELMVPLFQAFVLDAMKAEAIRRELTSMSCVFSRK